MGTALAERLLAAGYTVNVYNRTRTKADPLLARGAQWSDNPLAECDRVLLSLYTTETVVAVLNTFDRGLRPGQILIDTTTGDPEQATALAGRLAEQGVHYLAAPISGSSEQTRRGEATTIVGGVAEAFDACRDLFACFSRNALHVGDCGIAAKMKLVANLVLGLNRAALAEGLAFARALELPAGKTLDVLLESMAYSRIMETKGRKMVDHNFQTQAKLSQHAKDVRLMLSAAARSGLALPLTEAHRGLLEMAEAAGFGDADNSAVICAYEELVSGKSQASSLRHGRFEDRNEGPNQ